MPDRQPASGWVDQKEIFGGGGAVEEIVTQRIVILLLKDGKNILRLEDTGEETGRPLGKETDV